MFERAAARFAHAAAVALSIASLLAVAPAALASRLADPTRPPGYAIAGASRSAHRRAWNLSQILIAPDRRRAVINGHSVSKGDYIGGARVVEILPSEVKLRRKDRAFSIRLLPGRVKRPAR